MNLETLDKSIYEAERFIQRAMAFKAMYMDKPYWRITGCKESAAVRRTSLDLTQVLADLRQGR